MAEDNKRGVNTNFPNANIPEKQKNTEDFHKKYVQAIMGKSYDEGYALDYSAMDLLYQYYQGTQTGDEYKFLQETLDGEVMPAKWINYNKIRVKLKILEGELAERGYDIKVTALNKDAKVRKLAERNRLKTEMNIRPAMEMLEQQFGMPIQPNDYIPEDEEELDEYMEYSYKEKSEIIMESALKFTAKQGRWDYERVALLRDILIAGRCFAKSEISEGLPRIRRIDPRFMVWDRNAKDDFLSDATYFGEGRYMSLPEAAAEYQLSVKELEKAGASYLESMNSSAFTKRGYNSTGTDYPSLGSNLRHYRFEDGELRVFVFTANWQDYKTIAYKESVDKYGNAHFKQVKDTFKGESVTRRKVEIWRKGTIIGGEFLKHWGEIENQVRDADNLSKTEPQYKALIPDYFDGEGISLTAQMASLQDLKNIALYNVQLAMARSGAKGFIYDIAQLPEGWDYQTALKYLKIAGIGFIDSQKDGVNTATFNQFQTIDMTMSSSVEHFINISALADQQMDAITGINEARMGQVKNASQAVGVTQSALFQSNVATATLFRFFNSFVNTAFQHQAGLIKIAWAGKEKFAPIIGDAGINFLEDDIDLSLDSYGVFVEETPKMLDDMNMFHQMVQAALSAGQINFLQALKLMQEPDIKLGIRRFEKEVAKNEKIAEQRRQEEIQMQQQMMQQQQQAAQQEKQMESQADSMLQGQEDDAEMKRLLAQGRIDLNKEKMKIQGDLFKNFKTKE